MSIKPWILMDDNILGWMPNIPGRTIPNKFDLKDELLAFEELLKLRERRKIMLTVADESLIGFTANKPDNVKKAIASYFDKRISRTEMFVTSGSELDVNSEKCRDLLYARLKESQDDISVFVYAYVITVEIGYVVTCDKGFIERYETFIRFLTEDESIGDWVRFRRLHKSFNIGFPLKVLAEVQKESSRQD